MTTDQARPGEIFIQRIKEIIDATNDVALRQVDMLVIGTKSRKTQGGAVIRPYKRRLLIGSTVQTFVEKKLNKTLERIKERYDYIVRYETVDSGQENILQVIDISMLGEYRSLIDSLETDQNVDLDELEKQSHLATVVKFANGLIGMNRLEKTDLIEAKRQIFKISREGRFKDVKDRYIFQIKEIFDVLYYGSEILILNEMAFLAMFPLTEYLITELSENQDNFATVIDAPSDMISWVKGRIQTERKLYKILRVGYLGNLNPLDLKAYANFYPSPTSGVNFDKQNRIIWSTSDKEQVINLLTENFDTGSLSGRKRQILNSRYLQ
jgi:hypothetical protein